MDFKPSMRNMKFSTRKFLGMSSVIFLVYYILYDAFELYREFVTPFTNYIETREIVNSTLSLDSDAAYREAAKSIIPIVTKNEEIEKSNLSHSWDKNEVSEYNNLKTILDLYRSSMRDIPWIYLPNMLITEWTDGSG